MTKKYFKSVVPECGELTEDDQEAIELGTNALENFQELFPRFKVSRSLDALWELVRFLNKYVDTQAPWALAKQGDTKRLGTVLYVLLEGMRKVAVHLWPVMPEACETMLSQLGITFDLKALDLAGEPTHWSGLVPGTEVAAKSNVFPRQELRLDQEEAGSAKTVSPEKSATKKDEQAFIEFEDFQKVDLRVGTVVAAEPVPKTDKLLLMTIDQGEENPRQVVGGLAESWKPEDLVGRQVVVVANLKPRKLRGVVSQGMVLAVRTEEGLALLGPSRKVPGGSKVS
jgi:methionyl-tRNA synthetase